MFVKFDISVFFLKSVEKIQVSLKYDKNNEYFACRSMYIYVNISIIPRIMNVLEKIYRNQNTFYIQ